MNIISDYFREIYIKMVDVFVCQLERPCVLQLQRNYLCFVASYIYIFEIIKNSYKGMFVEWGNWILSIWRFLTFPYIFSQSQAKALFHLVCI